MNLSAMSETELRILLICAPFGSEHYKEIVAEIKKREAAKRWKEANESVINLKK